MTFMPTRKNEEYLLSKEVAEIRRMTPASLAAERYRGEGPPYIASGNRVLYPKSLLEQWLADQLVTPAKAKAHAAAS